MLFMPFNFLIIWLVGLLSIGVLGGFTFSMSGTNGTRGDILLDSGSAMVLWSLPVVLSACRSYVAKELNPSSCVLVLCSEWRPDGSVLQVEFYGPADGQPIIMSHGWGPNSAVWYYAKRQLSVASA